VLFDRSNRLASLLLKFLDLLRSSVDLMDLLELNVDMLPCCGSRAHRLKTMMKVQMQICDLIYLEQVDLNLK
jgi:hypothetical protein